MATSSLPERDPRRFAAIRSIATRRATAWKSLSWDSVGVYLSGLCMIHCLALPLLVAGMSIAGLDLAFDGCLGGGSGVHWGMFAAVVPIGAVALLAGHRKHRCLQIVALGLLGMLVLAAALIWGQHLPGLFGEQVLTLVGGAMMIAAHIWNRRRCQCCTCSHSH